MSKRRLVLGGLLGLLAAGSGGVIAWLRTGRQPAVNSVVENLYLKKYPDANGVNTDLNAYRGKVLVVNFWATWCAPCIEEMPELSELQEEMTPRGVQVLGMGIDNGTKILKFSQEVKVLYPLLVLGASGTELARSFGNEDSVLPFTVVIDRAGNIVDRKIGRIDKARMRRVILRTVESES